MGFSPIRRPPEPRLLTTLVDVTGPTGTDRIPTWSDILEKFYLAPLGVLPEVFEGGVSGAFPGGGPTIEPGSWIAYATTSSPYAVVYIREDDETVALDIDPLPAAGRAVAWRPDGAAIAFGHDQGVTVVSSTTGAVLWSYATSSAVMQTAMGWSPSGDRLAVGTDSHGLHVIDNDGNRDTDYPAIAGVRIYSVAWSPSGDRLAVTIGNGSPHYYVILAETKAFEAGWINVGPAYYLAWSSDGSKLAMGTGASGTGTDDEDRQLEVLDTATQGRADGGSWYPNHRVSAGDSALGRVRWSPDGQYLTLLTPSGLGVIDTDSPGELDTGWPTSGTAVIAFDANATRLLVGTTVYTVADKTTEAGWPTPSGVTAAAFAYDPGNVAS